MILSLMGFWNKAEGMYQKRESNETFIRFNFFSFTLNKQHI